MATTGIACTGATAPPSTKWPGASVQCGYGACCGCTDEGVEQCKTRLDTSPCCAENSYTVQKYIPRCKEGKCYCSSDISYSTPCPTLASSDPDLLYYQTCDQGFCKCYTNENPQGEFCSSPQICKDGVGCQCPERKCEGYETCSTDGKCMCGPRQCTEEEMCTSENLCVCGNVVCDHENGEVCVQGKCYCGQYPKVCGEGYRCQKGICVAFCGDDFCEPAETCEDGRCLCGRQECRPGEFCNTSTETCRCGSGGACASNQICEDGVRCVDMCGDDITCDPGETCKYSNEVGTCYCGTEICDNGNACNPSTNRCECGNLGKPCKPGQQCMAAPGSFFCEGGIAVPWWAWILVAFGVIIVIYAIYLLLGRR
jgi:hypothetical protein